MSKRKNETNSPLNEIKKIRLDDVPLLPIGLFSMEKMKKMIQVDKINIGIPFTINYGQGVLSCIIWNKEWDQAELINLIELVKQYPKLYVEVSNFQFNAEMSWCMFNTGCRDYPLRLAIRDLYNPSGSYQPISVLDNFNNSKHNLYNAIKLYHSVCNLWTNIEDAKFPISIFDTDSSLPKLANDLIQNLWIKDGNIGQTDLFSKPVLYLSPFMATGNKRQSYLSKHEIWFKLLKLIGQEIFGIKKQCEKGDREYSIGPFRYIELLFRFLSLPLNNVIGIFYNIKQVKTNLNSVLTWIESNTRFPQIVWRDQLAENSLKSERCVELNVYNDEDVKEFTEKVDICGSSWWPEPFEESIFSHRPFLIILKWEEKNRMTCKIVFDGIIQFSTGNYISEINRLRKLDNVVQQLNIIRSLPKGLGVFMNKIHDHHKLSTYFPSNTIVNHTTFYYNEFLKTVQFKICLFLVTKQMERLYFRKSKPCSFIIQKLLEEDKEDGIGQNIWEIGILMISIYKHFLNSSIGIESNWSLKNVLNSYQMKHDQRLWLFPYKCGWTFTLLLASFMLREPDSRPTFEQILKSNYFKQWESSQDLALMYRTFQLDEDYEICSAGETTEFDQVNMQVSFPSMIANYITLDWKWRKMNVSNAQDIIKQFTHNLRAPKYSCILMRNRNLLPIRFSSDPSVEKFEMADGRGPSQEGISVYWQALLETGLFDPAYKNNNRTIVNNRNSNHWFTLGLILGHCVLQSFSFFIDQPRVFFKILIQGCHFQPDPTDLLDIDPYQAQRLMDLYFMSDSEIDDLCLEFDGLGDPLLNGPVTKGTLPIYISLYCKKSILDQYRIANEDLTGCLEELSKGYNITTPDTRPTFRRLWTMFGQYHKLNATQIIAKIRTVSSHNVECLNNQHLLSDGSLCPISCLGKLLKIWDTEKLEAFLQFVTGTKIITSGNFQEIIVNLVQMGSKASVNLPTATSCSRSITLFYNKPSKKRLKDPESSFLEFKKRIEYAIENGIHYGIK
jgi:hypothetical protein